MVSPWLARRGRPGLNVPHVGVEGCTATLPNPLPKSVSGVICEIPKINMLASHLSHTRFSAISGQSIASQLSAQELRAYTSMQELCLSYKLGACVLAWAFTDRWHLVTDDGVPALEGRSKHVSAWGNRTFWIHGGFDGSIYRADMWRFDPQDSTWLPVAVNPALPAPRGRESHVACWDPSSGALWIHGGYDGSLLGDLWKFAESWTLIHDGSGSAPSPRKSHAAAWAGDSALLVFGGNADSGRSNGLWKFQAMSWRLMSSSGPQPRAESVAAWDAVDNSFWGRHGRRYQDLWKFAQDGSWTLISDRLGPRRDLAAAWDTNSRALWITSGGTGNMLAILVQIFSLKHRLPRCHAA